MEGGYELKNCANSRLKDENKFWKRCLNFIPRN